MIKSVKDLLYIGVLSIGVVCTVDAALVSRLGGQAYYDTDLDITWLADANLAATYNFGLTDINPSGAMTWGTANSWISALNADGGTGYLGYNDWRLPSVFDMGLPGCDYAYSDTDCGYNVNTVSSEFSHLFFDELNNLSLYNSEGDIQSGWGLVNSGPFSNLQDYFYWTDNEYALDSSQAWYFNFYYGRQENYDKMGYFNVTAVRLGDVAVVPVPAAIWLFITGLISLFGLSRR